MLQYQPKLYQICPSAYGVDATSIRILFRMEMCMPGAKVFPSLTIKQSAFYFPSEWKCACQVQRFFLPLQLNNQPFSFLQNEIKFSGGGGGGGITEKYPLVFLLAQENAICFLLI